MTHDDRTEIAGMIDAAYQSAQANMRSEIARLDKRIDRLAVGVATPAFVPEPQRVGWPIAPGPQCSKLPETIAIDTPLLLGSGVLTELRYQPAEDSPGDGA